MSGLPYVYDDGGRSAAGFRGAAGDCGTRAVAIALGLDYREVYDDLSARQKAWAHASRSRAAKALTAGRFGGTSARDGIQRNVYRAYLADLGWHWTPTMAIGKGTTHHVRPGEVPMTGPAILSLSRHFAAVVDGVLRDNHDSSRDGTRAVYGWWTPRPVTA